MSSLLLDNTVLEYDDFIALFDCGEPVSNDDGGGILAYHFYSFLNLSFRIIIESRGGFIEEHYW